MTGGSARQENLIARALVRILGRSGIPSGFGLLAAHGMVVTCAHVVALAAGEDADLLRPPRLVEMDFPFIAPGVRLSARVEAWRPYSTTSLDEFAGLVLDGSAPDGAVPLPVTRGGNVSDHDFLVYGYRHPEDRSTWRQDDKPVWVPGRITGRVEGGALQLGIGQLTGGLRIQTGYSGTPVLDMQTRQVVGLVSGGLPGRSAWLAYAISGESIYDAWPDLRALFGKANPFRALAPFSEADSDLFFGRDDLASYAAEQIRRSEHTIVSGASGTGKTSLISAGIIPQLQRAGNSVLIVRPSDRPSLWAVLAAAVSARARPAPGTALAQAEQALGAAFAAEALPTRVLRLCDELASDRVVVVADQFEELLLEDHLHRKEFAEDLWRLPSIRHPEGRPRVRVVVVVREDQLKHVRDFLPDCGAGASAIQVGPLNGAQLRAAIEEPVARSGFARYEERLADRILDDMRVQEYALPALQVTLAELWERDANSGLLRHATYQDINRPPSPLATSLERRWEEMGQAEKQEALRLFLHLAVPVGETGYARRTMRQEEAGADEWRIAGTLAASRLVVLRADPSGATAELMHDALIDQWPFLNSYLDANRGFLNWRDDLRRQIRIWEQDNRKSTLLLNGSQLRLALTTLGDAGDQLSRRERDFIGVSRRRRITQRRRLSAVMAAALVVVIAAASVIVHFRAQAGAQAVISTARQVDSLAEADLSTEFDTAQLLAVGAYQLHDDPQTEAALFQTATAAPQLVTYYQAPGPVTSLGTSANGQVFVAGTAAGGLAWFNRASGKRHAIHTKLGAINKVTVDATGSAVVASNSHEALLWEPNSGQANVIIPSGEVDITSTAISPSGDLAAIVQSDSQHQTGHVIIRNVQTGRQAELRFTGYFDQATFTSSQVITVYNYCGFWKSFRLPSATETASGGDTVCPGTNYIDGVSPNSGFSAYATYGSVTAWESANTSHIFSANGIAPSGTASSVTVSNDGKQAAIVEGGSIYVASLGPYSMTGSSNQGVTKLSSNGDTTIAAFMDSNNLVSATGTAVALWDLSRRSRIGGGTGISVPSHDLLGQPPEVSMSPDGHIMALQGGRESPYAGYQIGKSFARLPGWSNPSTGDVFEWRDDKPLFLDWAAGKIAITDSKGNALRTLTATIEPYVTTMRPARNGTEAVFVDQSANIWVLDLDDGHVSRFNGAPGSFAFSEQDVAVTGDGRFAIISDTGHDRAIAVDLANGATHVVGSGTADGVLYVNGKVLIQRDSGALEIWDESGTHLQRTLPGSGGYAYAMAASADGTRIARLTRNGIVSIVSTMTGDVLGNFALPSAGDGGYDPWMATSMQFTPDGETLFAETSGGQLTRWVISIPALEKLACSTAGRPMTANEWRDLVGTNPPARLPCQA